MYQMTLYIYASNEKVKELLAEQLRKHRSTDSGFDIPMQAKLFSNHESVHTIALGIHVGAVGSDGNTRPCLLVARSSIASTPFRLCNAIGLIDQGYRGEVKAKVDDLEPNTVYKSLSDGHRLFQLVRHDFLPWTEVMLVDNLFDLPAAPDDRGAGGFGSTGR